MDKIKRLLLENKAWAQSKLVQDPQYFTNMAKDQQPSYLWIGCSDSRVDPSELTNTQPGEMFVHRNVANLVLHTDLNLQSVIQYAVEVLKVDHIIVCGHYNCGGVKAAVSSQSLGTIDHWIGGIKATNHKFHDELAQFSDESERINRLVECNVMDQVLNLASLAVIQKSWETRKGYPLIHGWVYDLFSGLIKPIGQLSSNQGIDSSFRYVF